MLSLVISQLDTLRCLAILARLPQRGLNETGGPVSQDDAAEAAATMLKVLSKVPHVIRRSGAQRGLPVPLVHHDNLSACLALRRGLEFTMQFKGTA